MTNADITVFNNDKNLLVLLQSYCYKKSIKLIPLEFTLNGINLLAKTKPNVVIVSTQLLRGPQKVLEAASLKREALRNKQLKICALHEHANTAVTSELSPWVDIVMNNPIDLIKLDAFIQSAFPVHAECPDRRAQERRRGSDRRYSSIGMDAEERPLSGYLSRENNPSSERKYGFHLDQRNRCLVVEGHKIDLTPKEYELIDLLLTDVDRIFMSEEIVKHLWPENHRANKSDLYQYMHLLRKKIEPDPDHPRWLMNVKGYGYKLNLN